MTVNGKEVKPEFWVMRVLYHNGPQGYAQLTLSMAEQLPIARQVATCIERGTLAVLADNVIAEPVEVFETELEARAHREELRAKHPTTDFRVILNADVTL